MKRIVRQYGLTLWAIVARPWTVLMLSCVLLYAVPCSTAWILGRIGPDPAPTPVPVVDAPPVLGKNLPELAGGGRLATTTAWSTRWWPEKVVADDRGEPRFSDEAVGAWPILSRLPRLETLWMQPVDSLSPAGWERIGALESLEVLALAGVSSPAVDTPDLADAALRRLRRLRQLDLRGTGGPRAIVLPTLPDLEVAGIGPGRIEENLRRLATGSPRLRTLAIETGAGFGFTPEMIGSLRRMPALRTVLVGAGEDSGVAGPIATLRRALPGVAVHPGTYSPPRVRTAFVLAFLGCMLAFVFWFQATILLAMPQAWMMPHRLGPHLFWPLAVSALGAGMICGVARSVGVAWLPALTIGLFATLVTAGGTIPGDVAGWRRRLGHALTSVEVYGALAAGATSFLAPWFVDRWLSGSTPRLAVAACAVAVVSAVWKLVRLGRLPRIVAGLGVSSPPGLVLDGQQVPIQQRDRTAAGKDWQWWLVDAFVDRQIAGAVPATFASMLRRPQSRGQIPIAIAFMTVVMLVLVIVLPAFVAPGEGQPRTPSLGPGVVAAFAWQSLALTLAMTVGIWNQRRPSLVIDFLRPVSRRDYWRGLRRAITRDLVLPSLLGLACLGLVLAATPRPGPLPILVAAAVFLGLLAACHALILLIATTRWPLIIGTVTAILLAAGMVAGVIAFAYASSATKPVDVRTSVLIAGSILVVGVGLRVGVLWGAEDREIG